MARWIVFSLLCLGLLGAGCGKSDEERAVEKRVEKSTGADADVDLSKKGMKITGESEGGKFTVTAGEETEIPEDFPADVFIYRPSKAIMAMKIPEGYSIALTTQDEKPDVVKAYTREMRSKGWSEEASMSMGSQSVLVYEKEGRTTNISIVPSDDALQINVTVTTE